MIPSCGAFSASRTSNIGLGDKDLSQIKGNKRHKAKGSTRPLNDFLLLLLTSTIRGLCTQHSLLLPRLLEQL